jgi:hypothetical protein
MPGRSLLLAAAVLAWLAGTTAADQKVISLRPEGPWTGPTTVKSLHFLGATTIPNDEKAGGALVGGLSGLDYDRKSGFWAFVSDDRSEHAAARFYQGVIDLTKSAPEVTLFDMTTFGQEDGSMFPDAKTGGEVVDPESIRFDPKGMDLWWTSEGDRKLGLSPFVRKTQGNGVYRGSFPLPPIFTVHQDQELGPRDNKTLEGLSFTPDGDALWLSMESALYQDGPVPTVEAGAVARFTKFDRDGKVLGQYAYPLDPIPAKSAGPGSDNGVSEILALDDNRLLVIERSGVNEGGPLWTLHIRVYEADVADASDISAVESLVGAEFRALNKRLILNLDSLPELGSPQLPRIDNIEGVSFGPDLPNGHRSLLLVSDNNFNPLQITQFLAFEVLP